MVPLFSAWALPHNSGKAFQRDERLPQISPLLQFFDRHVIARFTARAPAEEGARYIDHVR